MTAARDGKNIVDIIYIGQDANYWVPALSDGFNSLNISTFGTPFMPASMSASFDVVSNVASISADWEPGAESRSVEDGSMKIYKGRLLFDGDFINESMHNSVTPYGKGIDWGYTPDLSAEYYAEYNSGIYIINGPPSLGIPIDNVAKLEYRVVRVSGYTGSYSLCVDSYDTRTNYTTFRIASNQSNDLTWVSDSLEFMYNNSVHSEEGLRFTCMGNRDLGLTSGISGDFGIGLHSLHKNEISGFAITPFHTYNSATFESLNSDLEKFERILTLETYLKSIGERSASAYSKILNAEGGSGRMVFFIQASSGSESTMMQHIMSIKDKITSTCLGLGFEESNFTFAVMIPAPISEFDLEFVSMRQTIVDAILNEENSTDNLSFINIPAIFNYTQMIENGWATVDIENTGQEEGNNQLSSFTGEECCGTFYFCCDPEFRSCGPVCNTSCCNAVTRCWVCGNGGAGYGVSAAVVEAGGPDTGDSSSDTSGGEGGSSSSSSGKNPFI